MRINEVVQEPFRLQAEGVDKKEKHFAANRLHIEIEHIILCELDLIARVVSYLISVMIRDRKSKLSSELINKFSLARITC